MYLKNIIIICLYILPSNFSYGQNENILKNDVRNALKKEGLIGAVWTIVDSNGISTDCAGFKNAETKENFKPSDKVHIGSIAKTILAVGVLRLATDGKINLDESVSKYLTDTKFINRWNATNPVTIRHLLDHTSGLSDAKLWHIFSTSSTPNTLLSAFYQNDPKILTIQAKPGSIYSYSNMGYTILGMLIESVLNQRYEKYLDENILKPLGMYNSTFHFVSQTGNKADKNLAMGHFDNSIPTAAQPIYLRPAGQITTTAYDMGLFLRFLMSDGKIGSIKFIDEKYLQNIGKQVSTEAFQNGVPYGYALGAYTRDRYGVIGISVIGNILGFAARVYWFPAQQKAFFISHNMDSETADYDIFNSILVKHLNIKAETSNLSSVKTNSFISEYSGYYIPVITIVEPFRLLDIIFSYTKVSVSDSGAGLNPMQKKSQKLVYLGNNRFSSEGRTNISHSFYKNENGKLMITDGISTMEKVSGIKILLIALSLVLGLLGLAYLLFSTIYQSIKFKRTFLNKPIFYVSFAFLAILASMPFLFTQPFISMGDKTIGNTLLYFGTILLPLLTIVSIIKYIKFDKTNWVYKLDFLSLFFVLQFSTLLFFNDLIPFALWK